jgi:hypothetical protein
MFIKPLALLLILYASTAGAATIHKCKNSQGKLEYSELPCEGMKVETKIKNNAAKIYDRTSNHEVAGEEEGYGDSSGQGYRKTRKVRQPRR